MSETGPEAGKANWGAVAVFLQAAERKVGILRKLVGKARDGEAMLAEPEFERRMANIYGQLNMAWNSRHGKPFASSAEEMARRGRFPEELRKEGEG